MIHYSTKLQKFFKNKPARSWSKYLSYVSHLENGMIWEFAISENMTVGDVEQCIRSLMSSSFNVLYFPFVWKTENDLKFHSCVVIRWKGLEKTAEIEREFLSKIKHHDKLDCFS